MGKALVALILFMAGVIPFTVIFIAGYKAINDNDSVHLGERKFSPLFMLVMGFFAVSLFGYAVIGVYENDLCICIRQCIHFHGKPMIVAFFSVLSVSLSILTFSLTTSVALSRIKLYKIALFLLLLSGSLFFAAMACSIET